MKYQNIIFVTHSGGKKSYVFSLPLGVSVESGSTLMAQTIHGLKYVISQSPSFVVSEEIARHITKAMGGTWPLASIEGKIVKTYEVTLW